MSPSNPPELVDWKLAAATAKRLSRPGPEVSRQEAADVVSGLREVAAQAQSHVQGYTGLVAPHADAPVLVVDRPGWCEANATGMQSLLDPLTRSLQAKRRDVGNPLLDQVGPKVTGVEAGTLLAFVSNKVLGQFDPYWVGPAGERGRLLLVAPNIVQAERELCLDPHDFRLWVALHEETHRVQFTAVPWLREHFRSELSTFLDAADLDAMALLRRVRDVLGYLYGAVRGADDERSLIDVVQSPAQRAVLERITAMMSLVEGHADVVMDGVGPDVVPSVALIRSRFQKRREGTPGTDRLLRRMLGLEAKMRQYRDGAIFVRAVLDEVGMDGFNQVWDSPQSLPSLAEIAEPSAWIARVHGVAA